MKSFKNRSSGDKPFTTAKRWFKNFFAAFLLFTLIFTAVQLIFSQIGGVNIFTAGSDDDEFALVSIVDSDNPFFNAFSGSKRINVLLLGLNPPLTDTIMLASFDPEQKRIDLISVPRDTFYPREGYDNPGQSKINAAYLGKPVNSAAAVSDVLQGMPIHYYALTEFEGVEKIVESMDGIPVNVPFHMRYIDNTKGQELDISIPEGPQTLDGKTAVEYLRFRQSNVPGYKSYAQSDLDREVAQQEFLKSAFQQSLSHLPSVVTSVHENVQSNIDLKTALKLTSGLAGMTKDDIYTYSLPGEAKRTDLWYFFPDSQGIKDMITQIYTVPSSTDGAIDAEI